MADLRLLAPAALGLLAALPAHAQELAPAEPIPLFNAVCVEGSARLSRKVASPADYSMLPDGARRALGATTVATRAEAEKLPAPDASIVTNSMYRIGDGQLYLLVPGKGGGSPIADSCIVLWYAAGDQDYADARRVLLPNERAVPIIARPTASPVGAATVTVPHGDASFTAAAFSGWVALRSYVATPAPDSNGAQ